MESVGFYDQHITPITYLISTSPVYKDLEGNNVIYFDLKSDVEFDCEALSKGYEKLTETCRKIGITMKKPSDNQDNEGMEWVIT